MLITVAIYRQGNEQFLQLEVGGDMTIADLKGLIEAEAEIPAAQIDVFVRNAVVSSNTQTLSASGLGDGDIIEVRVRKAGQAARTGGGSGAAAASTSSPAASSSAAGGGSSALARQGARGAEITAQANEAAERLRLQALSNPQFLRQMQQQAPEMAASVQDKGKFAEQYLSLVMKQQQADEEQQRLYARLEADPFDVEAQMKIEEIIREQLVMRNYEEAIENLPEAFAQVTMLYIPVEVNGVSVKAFVDSGAQTTIMSPSCAERCGILRLLDRRFGGIARGVGTAKILGRVHSAQIKLGSVHLACSFTVMEGKDVDLLFGLDMLKRHQAVLDLRKNALEIQGELIHFLPENEIPRKDFAATDAAEEPLVDGPAGLKTGARSGTVVPPEQQHPSSSSSSSRGGAAASSSQAGPSSSLLGQAAASRAGASSSEFPQDHIERLVSLGFSQEEALNALRATNGDVEQAAALLFG